VIKLLASSVTVDEKWTWCSIKWEMHIILLKMDIYTVMKFFVGSGELGYRNEFHSDTTYAKS
jgi:hypothetical protein